MIFGWPVLHAWTKNFSAQTNEQMMADAHAQPVYRLRRRQINAQLEQILQQQVSFDDRVQQQQRDYIRDHLFFV